MNKIQKTIAISIQLPLYSVLAYLIISGQIDGIIAGLPYVTPIAAIIAGAGLLGASLLFRKQRYLFDSYSGVFAVTLVVGAIIHLTTPLAAPRTVGSIIAFSPPPLFFLYCIVISLFAIASARPLWSLVWATIFCIELFSLNFHGYFEALSQDTVTNWMALFTQLMLPLAIPTGIAMLCGIFPYIVSRSKERQSVTDADATKSARPIDPKPSSAMLARTDSLCAQDTKSMVQTNQFSLNYVQPELAGNYIHMNDLLSSVVFFMSRNFKSHAALGFLFDVTKQAFVLNSFHSKSMNIKKDVIIPIGKGLIGRVGTDGHSFISGDLSNYAHELFYYHPPEAINSILVMPIISAERELFGALVIDSIDKQAFSEQHKDWMRRFSTLAAALVSNVQMRYFQERATRSFQSFYEASQSFTNAVTANEVYNVLLHMVSKFCFTTRAAIMVFQGDTNSATVLRILGDSPDLAEGFTFGLNNGLCSWVLTNRQAVVMPDFQQYASTYFRVVPTETVGPTLRSLCILPILDNESRSLGCLLLESNVPNQFTPDLQQMLSTLIANSSVALARAMLFEKMEKLATTDGLTGLNNHRHFQTLLAQEVERSKRYHRSCSLLLLDIDHFKSFNDTYGHPVGDLVLKEVAACINRSIRANDTSSRYGGEEFTVILPENNAEGAMVTAERVRRSVEQKIITSMGRELRVTISVGCATLNADYQPADLVSAADKALYYSKEHGRNRVTLYQQGM